MKFTAELAGRPEALDENESGASDGQVVIANVMNNAEDDVLMIVVGARTR